MEKDYPKSMQDTWNASLAACKDLQLKIGSQQFNPTESKIEAVAPPDTNVKIQLVARPNQITTLKVRFGLMGNLGRLGLFPPARHAPPGPGWVWPCMRGG